MRIIKQFPNYQISPDGKIQNLRTGRILRISKNSKGYSSVTLSHKGRSLTITVHKLVFTNYIGETRRGYDINHIDGNKNNNSVSNLELITRKENMRKAVENGQVKSGFDSPLSVPVQQIHPLTNKVINTFGSIMIASDQTNISSSSISCVINGYRQTAGGFKWKRLN